MRALVTGGAGFVGSRLVAMARVRGDDVLVLDDLSVGDALPEPGDPQVEVVTAALESPEGARVVRAFAPDTVFHLAALHFIPWCEQHPDEAVRANVDGTRWLLGLLDDVDVRRLVFASTVAVYGFQDTPAHEGHPRTPSSVYARTKVTGEDLVGSYAAAHPDVTVGLARLANVYGAGDANDHLIPGLCRRLDREVRAGNLWPRRDYVHVSDVACALLALADLSAGLHTYNVGTGVGTSVESIVDYLAELSGRPMSVVSDPARQRSDDGHLVADCTALTRATSWSPRVGLREGLAEVLASVGAGSTQEVAVSERQRANHELRYHAPADRPGPAPTATTEAGA